MKYKKLYKKSELIDDDMNSLYSISSTQGNNLANGNGYNQMMMMMMMMANKKSSSMNSFSINNTLNKGSFSSINSNPSYVFPQFQVHKKDAANQNRQEEIDALELYVLKTQLIAKHLQDHNNVLAHFFQVFIDTFVRCYEAIAKKFLNAHSAESNIQHKVIQPNKEEEEEEQEIIKKAISEVQQFIRVMEETIMLFYSLNRQVVQDTSKYSSQTLNCMPHQNLDQKQHTHFNRENMLNFVTSQLFTNTKLYHIIFMLIQIEDLHIQEQLKISMKNQCQKQPQHFYIQDRLCLNERTLEYFKKLNIIQVNQETDNQYTEVLSINLEGQVDQNEGIQTKQSKRVDKKYQSDNSQDEDKQESEDDDNDNESEEQKQKQNYSYGSINKSEKQSPSKNSKAKVGNDDANKSDQKKIRTQDSQNENCYSHQPTNCTTTSPKRRKSACKEVEYYYTSSFENQSDLFRENNINDNSQPQSFPYSSKNINLRGISDFDEPIKEKANEESQSESSSVIEESKTSAQNKKQQNEMIWNEVDRTYLDRLRRENYYRSLKYIMRIQKQQSPIGKMKMIVKASEHILTCINSFYAKHTIQSSILLDGDDILGLFIFFMCKCLTYTMNTHIKFINKFITSNLLNSVSGYYLTTLQISLKNILEFQEDGPILQSISNHDN